VTTAPGSTPPDRSTSPDWLDPFTLEGEPRDLAGLTAFDRCDSRACDAQAYVRARLSSGLDLVFCGHHGHEILPELAAQGAVVRDDSVLLVEDRLRAN
jgi:hypothetical protein